MSDEFFVSFRTMEAVREFAEILESMNSFLERPVVWFEKVSVDKHKGFYVKNNGNNESYGILWRKYFMRRNDSDIIFYDKNYNRCLHKTSVNAS